MSLLRPAVTSGKGLAKKDFDGDGKFESGAKEYRGAVHNAIQRKRGLKPDGKDTSSVKEGFSNWRSDLFEIVDDDIASEKQSQIKEKNVDNYSGKNKCVEINPKLSECVENLGGQLIESVELSEEYIAESVNIAAQYFCEQGLNETGVEILIDELGLDEFVSFVFEIGDEVISEARAGGVKVEPVTATGKPFKSGKPTKKGLERLQKLKAERKEREEKASSEKPSGMKASLQRQSAIANAKKQQPKKKGVLDRVAGAINRGIERHNAAMSAARETGKTIRKAAGKVGGVAKEVGKGASGAARLAGHVASKGLGEAADHLQIEAKKMKGEDPCWKGYEMVGTKKKGGKEVPNCVPKEQYELDEKITAKTDMGTAIRDFEQSTSSQLAGRTKEERRKAAIAAVLTARRGGEKLKEQSVDSSSTLSAQQINSRRKLIDAQRKVSDADKNALQKKSDTNITSDNKTTLKQSFEYDSNSNNIDELNRAERETGINTKTGRPTQKGGAKDDKAFTSVKRMIRGMEGTHCGS